MRRATLILSLPALLLLAGASHAGAGGLDLRIGGFFPRPQSCNPALDNPGRACFFQDLNDLYTPNATETRGVTGSDFNGVFGGIEYNTVVAPMVEVGVHFDAYGKSVNTSYRHYTRDNGGEIQQTLKLREMPLGITVRLVPTGRHTAIAPYIGGGVDAVFYRYEEVGDFIDFYDPTNPVVADHFRDSSAAFGVHGVAGVRAYLNRDFAIVAEGRYLYARKNMGQDFAPNQSGLVNRIDLSGWAATVGLHVRF